MTLSVGIDLGTTNSVVAFLEAGRARVVSGADGSRLTPSVVAFTSDGELLVGEAAKRQAVLNPDGTFMLFKRDMGSGRLFQLPSGRSLSPQELSARVLIKLIGDVEAASGEKVASVTVSVPAYFSDAARQATLEAARIAGVSDAHLVPEPTAAALSFGLDRQGSGSVLVFDFGGGTLDVSALEISDGVIEVRSVSGDAQLGGADFDRVVVDMLLERLRDASGVDVSDDPAAMQRLVDAAEQAKISLSAADEVPVDLPFLAAGPDGPVHLSTRISRSEFEEAAGHLVERIAPPVRRVLEDVGMSGRQFDHVLVVGGSSRIPAVRDRLSQVLSGRQLLQSQDADEAVAAGAALRQGVSSGEVKDVLILDVTPLALGVETKGGLTFPLVSRNTTVPVRRREIFTTDVDGQTAVRIKVVQGERPLAVDNRLLGEFLMSDVTPAPRGQAQLAVSFDIDADGVLTVTAEDMSSGASRSLLITGGSALSDEELGRMLEDAEKERSGDAAARAVVLLRNQCESLLYEVDRLLEGDAPDRLGPALGELSRAAGLLRGALASTSLDMAAVERFRSDVLTRFQLLVQQVRSFSARPGATYGDVAGDVEGELEALSDLV